MFLRRQQLRIEPLNKIDEGVYLGDHVAASNKFILQRHGITHILQVASGMYPKFPGKYNYKTICIDDIPSANLKQYFKSCHQFIEAAVSEGGTVLVHCWAGVSRSASIVIAHLMQKHGVSMNQAIDHVRQHRWFINPNPGFKSQIKRFEKELQGGHEEAKVARSGVFFEPETSTSVTLKTSTVLRQNQIKIPSIPPPLTQLMAQTTISNPVINSIKPSGNPLVPKNLQQIDKSLPKLVNKEVDSK
jgi:predicted protein tyrosine phosphatase